jgi:hypothetical protein
MRLPFGLKSAIAEVVAACVYRPMARGAQLVERLGGNVANWPLGPVAGVATMPCAPMRSTASARGSSIA